MVSPIVSSIVIAWLTCTIASASFEFKKKGTAKKERGQLIQYDEYYTAAVEDEVVRNIWAGVENPHLLRIPPNPDRPPVLNCLKQQQIRERKALEPKPPYPKNMIFPGDYVTRSKPMPGLRQLIRLLNCKFHHNSMFPSVPLVLSTVLAVCNASNRSSHNSPTSSTQTSSSYSDMMYTVDDHSWKSHPHHSRTGGDKAVAVLVPKPSKSSSPTHSRPGSMQVEHVTAAFAVNGHLLPVKEPIPADTWFGAILEHENCDHKKRVKAN